MIKIEENLYLHADEYQYKLGSMEMKKPPGGKEKVLTFMADRYFTSLESVIKYLSNRIIRNRIVLDELEGCRDEIERNTERVLWLLGLNDEK